ncbi:MAG: hypothetical protein GY866_16420 [Proteobacteria bacterium]|nr:hypothetical protein [Pseudomonadota bacterium]
MIDTEQTNESLHPIGRKLLLTSNQYRERGAHKEKSADYLNVICFYLLNELYGIELKTLQEIHKAQSISRVPGSSEYLKGILNLRGNLITVVDLKKRLGIDNGEVTRHARVMIVEHEQRFIGVLVDKVTNIVQLDRNDLIDPRSGFSKIETRFINKIGNTSDQVIIIPDLESIFLSIF